MEEREEEYQRARERIFAHDVRAVCVGGMGGGGMLHKSLCYFYSCANSVDFFASNYHCWIYEFIDWVYKDLCGEVRFITRLASRYIRFQVPNIKFIKIFTDKLIVIWSQIHIGLLIT